jgi:glycosyltransferase involved in cell wall biosynthesis
VRLVVVSPFLDRQHGTELCIIEQIERLARNNGWPIELYAQQVAQLDGVAGDARAGNGNGIHWHRISDIPGPHLLKFIWWFCANHWRRWRDRRSGQVRPDLVYTPGTNCLDADAIMVQIVFHAFYQQAREQLQLRRVPLKTWPLLIHRKLYYHLIMFLEREIYRNPRVCLIAVSSLIARQLQTFLGRSDVAVIPNTVDTLRFNPEIWRARRQGSRKSFHFADDEFVVLLIGNDWKKKGLDALLEAVAGLPDFPLRLMIVGADDRELYRPMVQKLGLQDRVSFQGSSPDVVQFYAAADLYAGPSLEDGFNLPILEAMACGLPVIASSQAGVCENITDGENGLILKDPNDHELLARLIRALLVDSTLRQKIASAAAAFVQANCSWDHNTAKTRELLERILAQRTTRHPVSSS